MTEEIVAIGYIPVLHKGYLDFLRQAEEKGATELYLIGDDILTKHEELDYINRKDRIRAVDTEKMVKVIGTVSGLKTAVLDFEATERLCNEGTKVITPNEDIGRVVVEHYFPEADVEYVNIFLRINRENVGEQKAVEAQKTILASEFQKKLFKDIAVEAEKSFDWWRQVGAALVKEGEVLIMTYNEHMPEAQLPNILGDARSLFKRGIHVNSVTSAHAEGAAIAEAARQGISTEGAELYVTDFPCPFCARIVAKSGIKTLYFSKGYAVLDGDDFFKEEKVEVVRIEI